ncbi:MAG TPA: hypothetical protein PKM88_11815 [bacterium]|nr:hypothetical protein [bacterium]
MGIEHPVLLALLAVLNLPVYGYILRLFFDDHDEIKESLRYVLMPDIISALRGEYWQDRWATLKVTGAALTCTLIVAAEYAGITRLVG